MLGNNNHRCTHTHALMFTVCMYASSPPPAPAARQQRHDQPAPQPTNATRHTCQPHATVVPQHGQPRRRRRWRRRQHATWQPSRSTAGHQAKHGRSEAEHDEDRGLRGVATDVSGARRRADVAVPTRAQPGHQHAPVRHEGLRLPDTFHEVGWFTCRRKARGRLRGEGWCVLSGNIVNACSAYIVLYCCQCLWQCWQLWSRNNIGVCVYLSVSSRYSYRMCFVAVNR